VRVLGLRLQRPGRRTPLSSKECRIFHSPRPTRPLLSWTHAVPSPSPTTMARSAERAALASMRRRSQLCQRRQRCGRRLEAQVCTTPLRPGCRRAQLSVAPCTRLSEIEHLPTPPRLPMSITLTSGSIPVPCFVVRPPASRRGHHALGASRTSWHALGGGGSDESPSRHPIVPAQLAATAARSGRDADVGYVTRHPCDPTPGPGKYDNHRTGLGAVSGEKTTFSSYERENEREGRLRRHSPQAHSYTSSSSRMAPRRDLPRYDATPGPGAYPAGEFSDFDIRPRSVRVSTPGAARAAAMAHTTSGTASKQFWNVRPHTSSFGAAPRSSPYAGADQSEAARFGYEVPRTSSVRPSASNYAPLGTSDLVYLSMQGGTPPPRFAKSPTRVKMYELTGHVARPSRTCLSRSPIR
jgi:hypothetical protein